MIRRSWRKNLRRYIARPSLQQGFRALYRFALAGMNYGGAASSTTAGDELALQRLAEMPRTTRTPLVIFDVGANEGSYVHQILEALGNDVNVYAFEPSTAAFSILRREFGATSNVQLVSAGLGATVSEAMLWSSAPGSVLASTFVNPIGGDVLGEKIRLVTVDSFCEEHGIERIDLLKIDVEGGELDTLRGAQRMLGANAITIIQFEFGQPSLGARTYFVDLFQLLDEKYVLFRVLPRGVTRIAAYHETLEVFMSTNYLAVSRERARDF